MIYSISGYGKMIRDRVRFGAYQGALRQSVKPGAIVLDIGTGIGMFALLACQLGAKRVYAIEPANTIQLAKQIAAANGYANRIEFIQDISTRVDLPERADVIVSDLRDILPLFQHHIPSIIDARKRFLAPKGILIPQRDTIWAAVLEAPETHRLCTAPWGEIDDLGLDLTAAQQLLCNTFWKSPARVDQLLTPAQQWLILEYGLIESTNASRTMVWTEARPGTAHGISMWFDTDLVDGVGFSNAPGALETVYGQAFLPFSSPIPVATGDQIAVTVSADLVGEEYVWRWETEVWDQGNPKHVKAALKQSSLFGALLSPAQLRKREAGFIPELTEEGVVDQFILERLGQSRSLVEVAIQVADKFKGRFKDQNEALTRVGELSMKYCR